MTSTECNFRRTPDRLDITPSRALCRQLFGPIDHSQLQEDLTRELTKMDQEATTKWNFDFVNDKPLEGNYLWSRFQHKDSTAKALTNSVRCRTEKSNNSLDAVTTVENEERPTHTNTDISNETTSKPELIFSDNEKKFTTKCSTKKKSSSRKITDVLRKTKRKSALSKPLLRRRRSAKQVQSCIEEFFRTDNATSSQA